MNTKAVPVRKAKITLPFCAMKPATESQLLWVNKDVKSYKQSRKVPTAEASIINSHSQQQARAARIAASQRALISSSAAKAVVGWTKKDVPQIAQLPVVVPAGWTTILADPGIVVCRFCGSSAVPHVCSRTGLEAISPPSPETVVQKGNSDPFSTSAIVVDSTVSQLLTFNRSCLLPSIHGREIDVAKTASYATSYWQDSIASLQDECQGCGYLARFAAILASITLDRKMMVTAMVFKQRSSELLRQRLANHVNMKVQRRRGNAQATDLCWSIYSLLTADVAAQNYSAAAVHGRMLTRFLQPDDPSLAVADARLLHAVLYNDTQRASVSMTRPSFDLNRLALDSLSLRAKLDEITGSPENFVYRRYPTSLDPALTLAILRNVFTEMRQLLEIAWMMAAHPELATDSLIVYLSSWVLICEGRLINYILDTTSGATSGPWDPPFAPKGSTGHTEACLAALYWLRRVSRHEGCGVQLAGTGTTVFNAGPAILRRLRPYLLGGDLATTAASGSTVGQRLGCKACLRIPASDQAGRSAGTSRLRLWISYVAALAERASRSPKTEFQRKFLQLSKTMRYRSWQDVRESVLKGFLYDESVDPDTPSWFEGAIHDQDRPAS